jgi:hypothetical protein
MLDPGVKKDPDLQQCLRENMLSHMASDSLQRFIFVLISCDSLCDSLLPSVFPIQGVNQETLQMANVPHFSVGGSIHLVVNNQVS